MSLPRSDVVAVALLPSVSHGFQKILLFGTPDFLHPSNLATPRTVHCECSFISFIENHSQYGPVFGYIGVSKLSCHLWIESPNETRKHASSLKIPNKGLAFQVVPRVADAIS